MATYYWVNGTGTWDNATTTNWSLSSGGVGGAGTPTSIDNVIFDINSGTGTCTTAVGAACKSWTFNSSALLFALGANLTATDVCTLTGGSISLNSYTFTVYSFNSSNSNTRSINFGTGKFSCATNGGTIWNTGTITGLTISGTPLFEATYSGSTGTRNISCGSLSESMALSINVTAGSDTVTILSDGSQKNLNFTGFSGTLTNARLNVFGHLILSSTMTYGSGANTLTFKGTSGTQQITTNGRTINSPIAFNGVGGTFAFQDALTQGSTRAFTVTNGTVQLKNGVTSTVGSFITSGTTQKFLQSTLAGSQATLSQASGTINANNLNIRDINAAGGATWNAYVDQGNTDAGNNLGWAFGASPQASYEITYRLRSFSTPRRF